MTTRDQGGHGRSRGLAAPLLALWLGIGLAGCNALLDVENPNNVLAEDLENPEAAGNIVNGALWNIQDGYGYQLMVYSTVSNELHWIGSRDAFQELEFGWIDRPLNEFSDEAFKQFAPAFWVADNAIDILEGHLASGAGISDTTDLARAYLYGAFMYTVIADMFDDWAPSDMKLSGPPVGPAGMGQYYTTAIGYLDAAYAIVQGDGSDLERHVLAMRARAKHAQGVWNLIGTRPISPGNGLLSTSDAAAAAADAVLALAVDPGDWVWDFIYFAAGANGNIQTAVNDRFELRFGEEYIYPTGDDNERDKSRPLATPGDRGVRLQDPIDAKGDPRLDELMTPFEDGGENSDLRVLSARLMYLILAEDALARNDMAEFATNINTVRGFMNMSDWVDGGAGMPTALEILIHERRVNLFLQGYRLNDMYRFGVQAPGWQAASHAAADAGTFFPLTKAELESNCHLNPDFECTADNSFGGGG